MAQPKPRGRRQPAKPSLRQPFGSPIRRDNDLGPGMYYEQQDFVAKTKNIVISGKYYEKPNTNPGPGYYDLSKHEN